MRREKSLGTAFTTPTGSYGNQCEGERTLRDPTLTPGGFDVSRSVPFPLRVDGPSLKATAGWRLKASEAEFKGAVCRDRKRGVMGGEMRR